MTITCTFHGRDFFQPLTNFYYSSIAVICRVQIQMIAVGRAGRAVVNQVGNLKINPDLPSKEDDVTLLFCAGTKP